MSSCIVYNVVCLWNGAQILQRVTSNANVWFHNVGLTPLLLSPDVQFSFSGPSSPPYSRNSDPGSHSRLFPPSLRHGIFPFRLASNCAYPRYNRCPGQSIPFENGKRFAENWTHDANVITTICVGSTCNRSIDPTPSGHPVSPWPFILERFQRCDDGQWHRVTPSRSKERGEAN